MKENIAYIVIDVIIGIGLSIGIYVLYPLLSTFDFIPYHPQLEIINGYCEKYTTKNIAEIGGNYVDSYTNGNICDKRKKP